MIALLDAVFSDAGSLYRTLTESNMSLLLSGSYVAVDSNALFYSDVFMEVESAVLPERRARRQEFLGSMYLHIAGLGGHY